MPSSPQRAPRALWWWWWQSACSSNYGIWNQPRAKSEQTCSSSELHICEDDNREKSLAPISGVSGSPVSVRTGLLCIMFSEPSDIPHLLHSQLALRQSHSPSCKSPTAPSNLYGCHVCRVSCIRKTHLWPVVFMIQLDTRRYRKEGVGREMSTKIQLSRRSRALYLHWLQLAMVTESTSSMSGCHKEYSSTFQKEEEYSSTFQKEVFFVNVAGFFNSIPSLQTAISPKSMLSSSVQL